MQEFVDRQEQFNARTETRMERMKAVCRNHRSVPEDMATGTSLLTVLLRILRPVRRAMSWVSKVGSRMTPA